MAKESEEEKLEKLFQEKEKTDELKKRALKHISSFLLDFEKDLQEMRDNFIVMWYRGRIQAIKELFPVEIYAKGDSHDNESTANVSGRKTVDSRWNRTGGFV
jgi:hypothetical protein